MSEKTVIVCDACGKMLEHKQYPCDWFGYSNCPEHKGDGTVSMKMRKLEGAIIGDNGHVCESCHSLLRNLFSSGYRFKFSIVANIYEEVCQ